MPYRGSTTDEQIDFPVDGHFHHFCRRSSEADDGGTISAKDRKHNTTIIPVFIGCLWFEFFDRENIGVKIIIE